MKKLINRFKAYRKRKQIEKFLKGSLGWFNYGLTLAVIADTIKKYTASGDREVRTIDFIFNNFFKGTYDFDTEKFTYTEGGK